MKNVALNARNASRQAHRVIALDGLRGVAILMVLGVHFLYSDAFPAAPPLCRSIFHVMQFGWMGVDLFFVLSGFLITGILLDTKLSPNYFRSFYARRALRIFPLYYLVLTLYFVSFPLLRHTAGLHQTFPDSRVWPFYFTYLDNWWIPLARGDGGAITLFWSLAVEEQFYLLWPCVVRYRDQLSIVRLCCLVCVLSPILRLLLEHWNHTFVFMSTLTRMDSLLWGALAALLIRSPTLWCRLKGMLPWIGAVCATIVLLIAFPLREFYTRAKYTQSIGFSVIAIGFAALLLTVWQADGSDESIATFFRQPVLTRFGRYSYGIYLVHSFILLWSRSLLIHKPWFGHSSIKAFLYYLIYNLACLGVAAISFHLYEQPFLSLKARFRAALPES